MQREHFNSEEHEGKDSFFFVFIEPRFWETSAFLWAWSDRKKKIQMTNAFVLDQRPLPVSWTHVISGLLCSGMRVPPAALPLASGAYWGYSCTPDTPTSWAGWRAFFILEFENFPHRLMLYPAFSCSPPGLPRVCPPVTCALDCPEHGPCVGGLPSPPP